MSKCLAISLGSNLGDRRAHLGWAIEHLRREITVTRVSSFFDTEPAEVPDEQPRYLNAALIGETRRSARALIDLLLDIERERGRERQGFHAARTLDLDLILLGDSVIDEPGVVVPHPRFRDRVFVLEPLAEIASDWVDPVTGLTVGELEHRVSARRT
jgi:2-amino-4-hydroxy-6-hydroxymethyldihydropteridine diphosphokinase